MINKEGYVMICFRDMAFCNSPVCTGECGRQWTPELQKEAEEWWGGADAPVAFSDFCSPKEKKDERSGERD